jgi:hypothetical protein
MPGIFGDTNNLALNPSFELWNQQTLASTSNGFIGDKWTLGLGTGSTFIASRAATGQRLGDYCAGISYTHAVASTMHQVAVLADMKGQTISFGVHVATATAGAVIPWVSTDGGTTKTYGQLNAGLGATTYELLKVEGIAVPTTATAVWYGIELRKTATILVDDAVLNIGSAVDTQPAPRFGKSSAAWSITSGASNRTLDMGAAIASGNTTIPQILGTLIRDLQNQGLLQ